MEENQAGAIALEKAMDAYYEKRYQDAAQRFRDILASDPSCYQAVFYLGMCSAVKTNAAELRCEKVIRSIQNACRLAKDTGISEEEYDRLRNQYTSAVFAIIEEFYQKAEKQLQQHSELKDVVVAYWQKMRDAREAITGLLSLYDTQLETEESKQMALSLLDLSARILSHVSIPRKIETDHGKCVTTSIQEIGDEERKKCTEEYDKLLKRAKAIQNDFIIPSDGQEYLREASAKQNPTPDTVGNKKKQGACYIATAVYGSYDAPQVFVLRQFRDTVLQRSCLGRLFIHIYYFLSPPIAKRLEHAGKMNRIVRVVLDWFVKALTNHAA